MSANRNIYIVGLTGGIASGKSEAAKYLESQGAHCIDADAISHFLTGADGPLLTDIRREFGDEVFNGDGTLNRQALADLVFNDDDKRRILDGITHPSIQKAMLDEVEDAEKAGEKLVFLNVPLLFETGMDALCDETWLINTDPDLQLNRLMQRDGFDEEQAQSRVRSQMSAEDKQQRADLVIDNNKSLEKMLGELQSHYNSLIKRINKLDNE